MSDNRTFGDVVPLGSLMGRIRGNDIAAMRRYWQSMRREGDVPRRSDIDPRGIEPLLENAMIAERIAPGLARLRIAGQHLSDLMGMEVRGMPVSAFIAPDHRDRLAEAMTALFEGPSCIALALTAPKAAGQPELRATMMLLPLRSDLGDLSRALGCLVTQGGIGRTPRRFDITHIQIDRLDQSGTAGPVLACPPGLAEPAAAFDTTRPALPSERPYLRLVKSE